MANGVRTSDTCAAQEEGPTWSHCVYIIKEVDGKAREGDKREAWSPFNWYAFTQIILWNLETGNVMLKTDNYLPSI